MDRDKLLTELYNSRIMNEKEWNVKRTCYICACITSDFVGTAVLWNTSEEAWKDAEERV